MNRTRLAGVPAAGMLSLVCMFSLAGCRGGGTAVNHEAVRPDASSFRAAFNADSGKVRALFLASPT